MTPWVVWGSHGRVAVEDSIWGCLNNFHADRSGTKSFLGMPMSLYFMKSTVSGCCVRVP